MKKTILIMVAAAAAAVSCTKEIETPAPAPVKAKVTVSATTEQPSTPVKSTLGSDDSVLWSEGDEIALFSAEGGSATTYTLTYGAGTAHGEFEGDEIGASSFVGVYPASYVDENAVYDPAARTIPVTVPAVQTFTENSFPDGANLSVAKGDGSLHFLNVMGVLEIDLTASSARSIKQVQIAATEPLAGKADLSIDEDGIPSLKFTSDTVKVITLTFDNAVTVSQDESAPTKVYAVLPAGALAGGFTISLMNANDDPIYAVKRTTKDNTIKRSVIRKMPAFAVSPTIKRSALANTIVAAPGDVVYAYPLQPATGELLGHFAKVANISLYSAVSGSKPTCSIAYAAYVKFTAGSDNEGCLGYALRDAYGVTLWSWLIWITDTPQDIELSDGTIIMDRNLGATATCSADMTSAISEAGGRAYQWGRKDPAYNPSSNSVTSSAETGTLEYVTLNPTAFIVSAEGSAYAGDWHWTGDDTLWDDTKTAYDPCPAGYKIPYGKGTDSFWGACDFAGNAGSYSATEKGYPFSVVKDSEDAIWFHMGTYYNNTGSGYSGGFYWNNDTAKMTTGDHYGRTFVFSSSKITGQSTAKRANAYLIRCEKIVENTNE